MLLLCSKLLHKNNIFVIKLSHYTPPSGHLLNLVESNYLNLEDPHLFQTCGLAQEVNFDTISMIMNCSKLRNLKKGLPQNKASPLFDWLVFNKVSLSDIFS